ncbi:MAG: 4Fe-4S binding protein [Bryobacterales bacterium]|nr:4Fe-4S binding protein [Bryobacterales bacterium]
MYPAAMFLFAAFPGMSLLPRKAFRGWLCPVGADCEQLWKVPEAVYGRLIPIMEGHP